MQKTRLKLDWTLNSASERVQFINKYMEDFSSKYTPTDDELEMAANYVLWGKDPNGTSYAKSGEIEIETRNKTWTRDNTDSLDEMLESPTFCEASLQSHAAPTKAHRETFSRSRALNEAPPSIRESFISLFKEIDTLDLCINFYELAHGKRKNPPREELIQKFTPAEQELFKEKVTHWNQFLYLKKRHLLVELRREQFTLRDSYAQPIMRQSIPEPYVEIEAADFDSEIPVFPLGTFNEQPISALIFRDKENLNPFSFSEEELKKVSKWIWEKENRRGTTKHFFDFCDLENVYQLFQQLSEMEEQKANENTNFLIRTLRYYLGFAELNEVQSEILDLKIKKTKNQDIADFINKKYGKAYTANYISTIFRQKIIPKINDAAAFHYRIVQNLFFEEEFKKCNCCGAILLRDPVVFVRKTRAKDGLANRCKKCDKLDRDLKKERLEK